jgi:MYXO-CTERM domain-containing protein
MWGLGGPIAANDDELCLAATDGRARLAACAEGDPDQAWVWWPRAACVSLACPEIGATCGRYDDGCGQPLDCGACPMEPAADAGPGEVEECAPPYCDAPDAGEPPPHAADGGPAPERSPAHDSGCATAGATPGPASALALLALLLLRRRRSPR